MFCSVPQCAIFLKRFLRRQQGEQVGLPSESAAQMLCLRNMTDALQVSTRNVSRFLENSILGHAHAAPV